MNNNVEKVTVFTPTYNRAHTLRRVYDSLIAQTYRNFTWLIIDDGSSDSTKQVVESFISDNRISIHYFYKSNGGKHSAIKFALEIIKTKYVIIADSDDILTSDAIEILINEWIKLESDGIDQEFAEVRAQAKYKNGLIVGDFIFPPELNFIDSTWHEMVLKYKNNNEHQACRNVLYLREVTQLLSNYMYKDRVSHIYEDVLWSRLGRKYKTRYIKDSLRIYNIDMENESISRTENKTIAFYNFIVSNIIFLDENIEFYFWNRKYFNNRLLKLTVAFIELKLNLFTIFNAFVKTRVRLLFILFLPLSVLIWCYYKFLIKKFWL